MKLLLAVLLFISVSVQAQQFEQFVLNEVSPWHHDSQYISSIAEDEASIAFSTPILVSVKPNKIYSHLEFKVERYDNTVLLTAQLIKHPEMSFVNTLIQDHYRYYKITFSNGLVYTYQEPYNTTYADKNIFVLLKGAIASNNKKETLKAESALYALMCKLTVKSIQPFEAHYNTDTRKKGAYEPKEAYVLSEDTAKRLMQELL